MRFLQPASVSPTLNSRSPRLKSIVRKPWKTIIVIHSLLVPQVPSIMLVIWNKFIIEKSNCDVCDLVSVHLVSLEVEAETHHFNA